MSSKTLLFVITSLAIALPPIGAQTASARNASASASTAEPKMRGIFEPISYPEDIELTGVFFVTPDIGWVTGRKGTLLRTRDGGDHWDSQMGGESASNDRPLFNPRFIDETHGWVVQSTGQAAKLLATTDGDRWGQVGTIAENYTDYRFTTATEGVYAGANKMYRTKDGGRSWREVATCRMKVQSRGITRDENCRPMSIAFPTLTTGYAVGEIQGTKDMFALLKTEDGGDTWTLSAVPNAAPATTVFFVDERTGYVRTVGSRMFVTTDGGATWNGTTGSPGPNFGFADPEVGWSFNDRGLLYTIDGGKRWDQRAVQLPAHAASFSLPRRDRGFVVGPHGMIFRYRVVPATFADAKSLDAPVMPPFSMALDVDVSKLGEQVGAFEQALDDSTTSTTSATTSGRGAGGRRSGAGTAGGGKSIGGAEQSGTAAAAAITDATPFMKQTFGRHLGSLQLVFEATTGILPDYIQRYRSLNILAQGLRTANALPTTADSLKAALRELRGAADRATARAALDRVRSHLASLRQVADTALLKQGASAAPPKP